MRHARTYNAQISLAVLAMASVPGDVPTEVSVGGDAYPPEKLKHADGFRRQEEHGDETSPITATRNGTTDGPGSLYSQLGWGQDTAW
jgi:hypothetical protein